jgi:hypothetical protein
VSPPVGFLVTIKETQQLVAKACVHVIDLLLHASDSNCISDVIICATTITNTIKRRWHDWLPHDVQESLSEWNGQSPGTKKDHETDPQQQRQAFQSGQLQALEHFGRSKDIDGYHWNAVLDGHAQKALADNGILFVGTRIWFGITFEHLRDTTGDNSDSGSFGQGLFDSGSGSVAVSECRLLFLVCVCRKK